MVATLETRLREDLTGAPEGGRAIEDETIGTF